MTEINSSLLPTDERPELPPFRSPRGNYDTSVINAFLVSAAGAVVAVAPGSLYSVVFFTQDYLNSLLAIYEFEADTGDIFYGAVQIAEGALTISETVLAQATVAAGAVSIVGTTLPGSAGEEGIFTINGVAGVNGYLHGSEIPEPGWDDANAGGVILCNPTFVGSTESGVPHGEATFMDDVGALVAELPIILQASDYTQAIRDAGNVIALPVAAEFPNGATARVVGVFERV